MKVLMFYEKLDSEERFALNCDDEIVRITEKEINDMWFKWVVLPDAERFINEEMNWVYYTSKNSTFDLMEE